LTIAQGDSLEVLDWRVSDPSGDRLYQRALRFEQLLMQEREWEEDPVIKDLLRQIEARKYQLAQAEPEVAAGQQPI
jgi:hypothetical protein